MSTCPAAPVNVAQMKINLSKFDMHHHSPLSFPKISTCPLAEAKFTGDGQAFRYLFEHPPSYDNYVMEHIFLDIR